MKHARLQPSSAKRWLECPGSVISLASVPDPGSEAADLGQACHMALVTRLTTGRSPEPGMVLTVVDEDSGRVVEVELDDELLGYVDRAAVWVEAAIAADPRALLRTEALSPVGRYYGVPADLSGHSDVLLVGDEVLTVVDAKFGRVEVDVRENPQTTLYAIGHAEEYGWRHRRYRLAILQPRSPQPVKVEELSDVELRDRAERYRPRIQEALQPDARLVPGAHCRTTYCKAAGVCRALQERARELAARVYEDPQHVSAEQLAETLRGADLIRHALDAAESSALAMLRAGQVVPGWKRVAGRGQRRWRNEHEAGRALAMVGLDPFKKVLLSPNQAEEALGGGVYFTALAPKKPGQPTLAPETDERPALEPDSSAFDAEEK